DRDAITVSLDGLRDDLGVGDSDGSEDHPVDPELEHLADRREGANPTAHLHLAVDRFPNAGNGVTIRAGAESRTIEIDDVDPLGASGHPAAGGIDRIGIEGGLSSEVTFDESHGLATAYVDGGVQRHHDRRPLTFATHRSRIEIPTSPLFSG